MSLVDTTQKHDNRQEIWGFLFVYFAFLIKKSTEEVTES